MWKQTTSGARTYYLYAGGMSVCELDSSGNVTATNTGGPAGLLSRHTSSGSTFYTYDPQGNPVQRLSGTGTLIGTSLFDAYGLRASTDGSIDPYSGYHSQEGYFSDNETGFELLGYYDPSTCRFVTRDPAGYGGGMNLYGYCDGTPIGESDPSGLSGSGWNGAENAWNNFKNTPAGRFFTSRWGSPVVSGALDDVFSFHDARAASYTPKGYTLRNQLRVWGSGLSLALLIPSGGEGAEIQAADKDLFYLVDHNVPKSGQVAAQLEKMGYKAQSVLRRYNGAVDTKDEQIVRDLQNAYGDKWRVITKDVTKGGFPPENIVHVHGGNNTSTFQDVMNILTNTHGFR